MIEKRHDTMTTHWCYEILPGKRLNFQMHNHTIAQLSKEQLIKVMDSNTETMIKQMWKEMIKEPTAEPEDE